jgi:hypothetical protein
MQSFLQYRQFGKNLRQQVERHGNQAAAGDPKCQAFSPIDGSPNTTGSEKDLEAGDALLRRARSPASIAHNRTTNVTTSLPTNGSSSDETLTEESGLPPVGTRLGNALTGVDVRSQTNDDPEKEKIMRRDGCLWLATKAQKTR